MHEGTVRFRTSVALGPDPKAMLTHTHPRRQALIKLHMHLNSPSMGLPRHLLTYLPSIKFTPFTVTANFI